MADISKITVNGSAYDLKDSLIRSSFTPITGTGTAGQAGSSSAAYIPSLWTFDLDKTPTAGDILTIKIPIAGVSSGVWMSVDNGTTYYPVAVYNTMRFTTHYPVNDNIILIYQTGMTTATYGTTSAGAAKGAKTTNVTLDRWCVLNSYDSGNTTYAEISAANLSGSTKSTTGLITGRRLYAAIIANLLATDGDITLYGKHLTGQVPAPSATDNGKIIKIEEGLYSLANETTHYADDIAMSSSDATTISSAIGAKLASSLKGAANGLAELDSTGKVPSTQLPSYVDDVEEYDDLAHFPATGETGKIYVDKDTDKTYRWGGSTYVVIGGDLALGETSSTAYRGDHGKDAYDHATDSGKISSAQSSGLYKVAVTSEGHIASVTDVAKADITALGIPAQDTTYSSETAAESGTTVSLVTTGEKYIWNHKADSDLATTSSDGLMSSTDKTKLDNSLVEAVASNIASSAISGQTNVEAALTSLSTGKANASDLTSAVATLTTSISKAETLIVNCGTISSLPITISNANIESDMAVIKSDVGDPSVMSSKWQVSTGAGSLTITGSINGATSLTLYLQKTR